MAKVSIAECAQAIGMIFQHFRCVRISPRDSEYWNVAYWKAKQPVWWKCRHDSFRRLVCVLQCSSSTYFMFFWKDNPGGIHFYQIWQIPCRARGTRAQKLFLYPLFPMDGFVHEHMFSFCKAIDCCLHCKKLEINWWNISHNIIFYKVTN